MAHIKTYVRIKPSKSMFEDYKCSGKFLRLCLPENLRENTGLPGRSSTQGNHEFKFTGIFNKNTSQKDIFETAAKGIVEGFLNGFNGTIFAYGQTGSGKTYTVEGGARQYEDRGLAPRALSVIYNSLESRQETEDLSIHVSYLEIYQEVGYDLLSASTRSNTLVAHLPKVTVIEGPKGSCIMKNLSSHLAPNEDVAQNLLLLGQANRTVAETPMNQRSSRSHAVFTVQLTAKQHESDVITKSKLHLVDLAGSERAAKSGIEGQQLAEAKFINLSLYHLEGVIIALQRGSSENKQPKTPGQAMSNRWVNASRPGSAMSMDNLYSGGSSNKHIPYRNSLLTMILRDSIGGNCQTAMIAAISLEEGNLGETLSTCKFAQRVACITNILRKNEEIDDKSMIKRLRKRIAELETEISLLKSGEIVAVEGSNQLTDEEKVDCNKVVKYYLAGRIQDPIQSGITNPYRFRECMRIMRIMIFHNYAKGSLDSPMPHLNSSTTIKSLPISSTPTSSNTTLTTTVSRVSLYDSPEARLGSGRHGYSIPATEAISTPAATLKLETPSDRKSQVVPNAPWKLSKSAQNKVNTEQVARKISKAVTSAHSRPPSGSHEKSKLVAELPSQVNRPGSASTSRTRVSSANRHSASKKIDPQTSKLYQSTFEKKKEQEIQRLDKKIQQSRSHMQEQQRHLHDFQSDVKGQQLRLLQRDIRAKLEETKCCLSDHQKSIQQLVKGGAESELIQRERLVERQLQKREAKMSRRLMAVQNQLNKLKTEFEEGKTEKSKVISSETKSASRPKITEKFSTWRDGKSAYVLENLQAAEKKQSKENQKFQEEIHEQTAQTMTQELQTKEMATRLKLQEFRKKLKETRAGVQEPPSIRSINQEVKNKPVIAEDTIDPHGPRPIHSTPKPELNRHHDGDVYDSVFSRKHQEHKADSVSGNKMSRLLKPTDLTNSFSVKHTRDCLPSDEANRDKTNRGKPPSRQNVSNFLVTTSGYWPTVATPPSQMSSPIKGSGYDKEYTVSGLNNSLDDMEVPSVPGDPDGNICAVSEISYGAESDIFSDPFLTVTKARSITSGNMTSRGALNTTYTADSFYESDDSDISFTKYKKTIKVKAFNEAQENRRAKAFSKEKLEEASFETTLKKMLDETVIDNVPATTPYHVEDYDKYARVSASQQKVSPAQKDKTFQKTQQPKPKLSKEMPVKSDGKGSRHPPSPHVPWGPEAKGTSVSDRLAQYSETDSLRRPVTAPFSGSNSVHTKDEQVSEMHREHKHTQVSNKIQANKSKQITIDDEREQAYMNTARQQKDRVSRIRKAQAAAHVIQRAWRNHKDR